jgi:hypothetical protein
MRLAIFAHLYSENIVNLIRKNKNVLAHFPAVNVATDSASSSGCSEYVKGYTCCTQFRGFWFLHCFLSGLAQ